MRLDGTTIVVTGAAHGLGRAMARGFVTEGASVAGVDIDADGLEGALASLDGPGEAIAVSADVGEPEPVRGMVDRVHQELGPIDVLVNNAGVKQLTLTGEERSTWAVPVAVWDRVLETNLRGPFLCSRAVLPAMLDRSEGRLIHVTSGHGRSPRARRAPYVASKFALEGLHQTLARELAGTRVDSVAFAPPGGGVRTREATVVDDPESLAHEPEVVVEPMIQLAGGAGEHGGRYRGTPDGRGVVRTD